MTSTTDPVSNASYRPHWGPVAAYRSTLIHWFAASVVVVLILGPLVPIFYQSFMDQPLYVDERSFTIANYTGIAGSTAFLSMVANSFLYAGLSTIASTIMGVALAILVGRTDMPGRKLVGGVVLWPLFLSPLLLSIGWFILYGPAGYFTMALTLATGSSPWNLYSILGMSLVAGVAQAPVTVLYCLASTAMADARMEDAARSCGAGPWRTVRHVTLPMLLPAILFSAVLNFINALESLSIPLIIGQPAGIRLFMTYIYEEAFAGMRPNYGLIGAASTILLAVISILIWLQKKLLGDPRRFTSISGKASRPRTLPLGALRWPTFIVTTVFLLAVVVMPLGAVVLRAFVPFLSPLAPFWGMLTTSNFEAVINSPSASRAVTNTLIVSLLAATLGTALAVLVGVVSNRSTFRWGRLLEYVTLFPRAIPGMIAGIGLLYVMMYVPQVGWLRNSIWIIVLAYVARGLPVAMGAIGPSLAKISPDLDRAARVAGADWWTSMRAVVFGLIKPAMFASFALMFIAFTKEYSTAIFLVAPGSEVLGVRILQAWDQGGAGLASALATIQIGLLVVFLFLARRVFGVKIHG